MKFSSRDIEEQKKYIRENFKNLEGYITLEEAAQEKEENIVLDASNFKDCKYQHLDDSFFEWWKEKRQRSSNFFGTENDYNEHIYPTEEIDIETYFDEICEGYNSSCDYEEPLDTSERRVWGDEGLMETELEYLHRVCYMDCLNYLNYPWDKGNDDESHTIFDCKTTKGEYIKMIKDNFNEKFENVNEENLKTDKFDDHMMKYHMLQQVYSLLFKDDNMEDYRIAWYNELIEKANKEAINQAYLKGYEDGHRDGYNDCIREKEESNYKLPDVEDSGYDYAEKLEEKDLIFTEKIPF